MLSSVQRTTTSVDAQDVIDGLVERLAVLDGDGTIISVNAAWRHFGLENGLSLPDGGVGASYLSAATDPHLRAGLMDVLTRRRSSFTTEYPCHSPSAQRWFLMSVAPLPGVPGAVVSHVDITRRRVLELEGERALDSVSETYRVLFRTSRDGLVLVDRSTGLITTVNDALVQLVGRSAEALEGTPHEALFPIEGACAAMDAIQQHLREPTAAPVSLDLMSGDGVVPVELLAGAIDTVRRQLVLLTLRDARPRVALEKERERLAAAGLKAQKLELAGQLAAGIAHDMNNTLSIVSGALEELRAHDGRATPELLHDLSVSIERGRELMKGLLSVGRRVPPRMEPFDAGKLVHECARMLQRVLPKTISIRTQLSGALQALGDSGQWYQALMNLALNARNAMPAGGTLVLAAKREGERIALSVTDDGVGMSEAVRARALEPFFTTREGQATGLGLSHVNSVAEAHGSSVELVSAPGAGTTVRVSVAVAPVVAVAEVTSAFHGRALVVDDEPLIRRSVCRLLRDAGLTPEPACDGQEALQALEREPVPEFLVTDLQMPVMDGLELVRRARAKFPSLPVLVVSGLVTATAQEELQRHRAEVMEKPFTPGELVAALVRARRRVNAP